jgi:hypothetical protein
MTSSGKCAAVFSPLMLVALVLTGCDMSGVVPPAGPPPAPPVPVVNKPAPPPVRVPAQAGVGRSSTNLSGIGEGFVKTPVKVYFKTKERIAFEIAIPHALDLYNATNGYYPKSEEEFMEQIIKFNNIELPELPEGHKYVYDVEHHELMVEQPGG